MSRKRIPLGGVSLIDKGKFFTTPQISEDNRTTQPHLAITREDVAESQELPQISDAALAIPEPQIFSQRRAAVKAGLADEEIEVIAGEDGVE